MQETIYDRINSVLTWKRIAAFNIVLLLALVIPLSIKLSNQDTELRSNAANEDVLVKQPTPPPNYPLAAPKIERVNTFYGKPGDSVVIVGDNFGEYKWGSKLVVGNSLLDDEEITRWSNTIIEAQIPEESMTGEVRVVINEQEAKWNGKIIIYDANRSARVGMIKQDTTNANLWIEKGNAIQRGIIELAYLAEPIQIIASSYLNILSQNQSLDVLGKKLVIEFEVNSQIPRGLTNVLSIAHPELGSVEIIRVELYDVNSQIIEVYSDPISSKI